MSPLPTVRKRGVTGLAARMKGESKGTALHRAKVAAITDIITIIVITKGEILSRHPQKSRRTDIKITTTKAVSIIRSTRNITRDKIPLILPNNHLILDHLKE
jgi:hypothetical protein